MKDDKRTSLIFEVKKHECLYNYKIKEYSNRQAKRRAWTLVARELGWTEEEAKKAWTSLREYASTHRATLWEKPSSGSRTGTINKPFRPWPYAGDMEFLKPFLGQSRTMNSNIKSPAHAQPQEDPPDIDPSECFFPGPSMLDTSFRLAAIQKKSPSLHPVMEEYMQSAMNVMQTEENPLVLWFKGLVPKIERLNVLEQLEFQNEVSSLLLTRLRQQDRSAAVCPDTHNV